MGFSRQEYWHGLPCSSPIDLPDLGIEPESPVSPAFADRFFTTWETQPRYVFPQAQGFQVKQKSAWQVANLKMAFCFCGREDILDLIKGMFLFRLLQ